MDETSTELTIETDPQSNLTDLLEAKLPQHAEQVLFRVQDEPGSGTWREVSAREFREEVIALARGLIAEGIEPGDRVGLMSRTRYEWAVADFAIFYAGAVTVPIFETSSPSQIAWNMSDSGAKAIIVETSQHLAAVKRAARHEELALRTVWQIDADDQRPESLASLRAAGEGVSEEQVQAARGAAGLEDTATIIYTSGTTGRPKGCALTHGNFVRLSAAVRQNVPEVANERNTTLLFLPLAHVFARFIHVVALDAGITMGHSPDLKYLTQDIASLSPDFLLVVPRVFEKIYNGARSRAHDASAVKGRIFDWAERVGVAWSETVMDGRRPSLALRAQYATADRLVFAQLRRALGGKVKWAVSGGGPLVVRLAHFFHAAHLKILEGYGLTETTAPATVGTVQDFQIGTVGPPLPGTSVRIAADGEVELRGVGIMAHYWRNEKADAESFTEDGWFRTGDLGELTERGMLKITGRKKEVIVTAGGKNVIPATYEDLIRASPLVSQCVVLGDGKPFIAALITLDEETLPKELGRLGLDPDLTAEQAAQTEEVGEAVQRLVDRANESVSRAESVRAFRIIPRDFTEESGHLTPSMKIRRPQVMRDYQDVIEEIYSSPKPTGNDA